nr:immunoglobulin heavy chain junction region [Macaca mulatta]
CARGWNAVTVEAVYGLNSW